MTVTATYHGDEIKITFTAQQKREEHGGEIIEDTIEVYALSILGVYVCFDDLPHELQKSILQLSYKCEFEQE